MNAILKIDNFSNYEIYPKEGKVWSNTTNKFIGSIEKNRYWKVGLYDDNGNYFRFQFHRVIYTACYGEIPEGLEVNHIDENPSNNSIFNLNLMTRKENVNWGTRNERAGKSISKTLKGKPLSEEHKQKLSKIKKGKPSTKPFKPVGAFKDGVLQFTFKRITEADALGYSHSNIIACCKGKRKSHKGYEWRYID